ncbi:MAG: phasin family protein [Candidatus Auribacterota bacterium]|nr:phasin family protein [Candidatus Auribacterota bacterium]
MIDLIKKTMYLGVGLAYMTKEKVEEISQELIKKGELSATEGKEFIDDLTQKSEEARKALEERVDKLVKSSLARMKIATRDDLSALEKKIAKLEDKSKTTGKE